MCRRRHQQRARDASFTTSSERTVNKPVQRLKQDKCLNPSNSSHSVTPADSCNKLPFLFFLSPHIHKHPFRALNHAACLPTTKHISSQTQSAGEPRSAAGLHPVPPPRSSQLTDLSLIRCERHSSKSAATPVTARGRLCLQTYFAKSVRVWNSVENMQMSMRVFPSARGQCSVLWNSGLTPLSTEELGTGMCTRTTW